MSEIVLSAFLTVFFEKLASESLKKLGRSQGIHSELKKLKRLLSQIKALLNDASEKEITNQAVKEWLNGLQHLAYEIDDVLEDLETDQAIDRELAKESGATASKVRKFIPTCCKNFSLTERMHGKLDDITNKLQELVDERNNLGLIVKDEPKKINRKKETCLPDESSGIIGRQDDKKVLIHKLLEVEPCTEKFSIVPIIGMGGVGKTTLARLLYNEKQVNDHFEIKAWVCVSHEFDVFYISKVLYQYVTGEDKGFMDLGLLQVAIREKLKEKRFLLVLDDVWSDSYDDWESLVRPFHSCAPGSKIIITTRKEQLLKKLGYDHLDHVESLSSDDALSLLARHALGVDGFDSHPTLQSHGVGIVKKCGGLPLALRAVGRLLRTKIDEEDWEDVLNSEVWELDDGDEIVPALRLSYHDLPACLKQLFAYCSLFPKDYLFDKEDLILLWMAEGFLQESKTSKSLERLGRECFDELLSRSFFQHAPNENSFYMMHDLMNDLATSVAGDFFLRLDDEKMKKEASKKYRHMSFVRERYVVYEKFKEFKRAKSLRTFLAVSVGMENSWRLCYLSDKILVDLLPELTLLRVLRLSCFPIMEIPEYIGSLKHLRYLNLSKTNISHLPENVCNLYNLQTLIVFDCYFLGKLPDNFIKLKNLRHLDIRGTSLEKMPLGIGKLKNLQTLPKIVIGGDNGLAIPGIKNLNGELSIKWLDKVQNAMQARELSLLEKRISELKVEWSDEFDGSRKETLEMEVLQVLEPHHDSLKNLSIMKYGGIKFPNWVGEQSFLQLTRVSISGCKKCTALPPLGQLLSLKDLLIESMYGVKVVGSEFFGVGQAFPSLEILKFRYMRGWEEWSTESGVVNSVFPCLQKLHIEDSPKLVKVSLETLPSLRVLKLRDCDDGVLRSLVHVASSSVTKLDVESISGLTDEVWGGVMQHLGALKKVHINGCNEIRCLWESEAEAGKVLVNLSKLEINDCSNFVSLGEKEKDEDINCESNLTSLKELSVRNCPSMVRFTCPNSIEELMISDCDSMICVFYPKGGKNLKLVYINNCKQLVEKELGGGEKSTLLINNKRLSLLERLEISYWPNLKSISDLSHFVHLTELIIISCSNLESFPDHMLMNLTLLVGLVILDCPNTDASFSHGLWPPRLRYLHIGRLKKPISQWCQQNFPISLVELVLRGEDVSDFSQLSHFLPSFLSTLRIEKFEKLESFSMGLQHLTSLQLLDIFDCPKLTHLPGKTLLSSLSSLRISGCPYLTERCKRRGSYRPLISHIACIMIDGMLL